MAKAKRQRLRKESVPPEIPRNGDLLRPEQAAAHIGLRAQTLAKWRCEGHSGQPSFIRVGRLIFYRRTELDRWLSANTVAVA